MRGMFWVYVAYTLGIGLMLGYGAYIYLLIRQTRRQPQGTSAAQSAVAGGDSLEAAHRGNLEVKG